MIKPDLMNEVISMIETEAKSRPSPVEFEMAYQARVAIDRIRFAIRESEILGVHSDPIREVKLQLLDGLDRLEAADRHFQDRWRHRGERRY